MASILAPVLYLVALVGSLLLFSRYYRKRAAARLASDPWFPTHPDRDTYISLLQQTPTPHETLLKAALLRRAVADVNRILRFREDKPALNNLLQKGSINDDMMTRFLAGEKELEAEIVEVVTEANTFREGWGQIIFQSASEIMLNEKTKESYGRLLQTKAALESKSKKRVKAVLPSHAATNGTPSQSETKLTAPAASAPAAPAALAVPAPVAVLNGVSSQVTSVAGSDAESPARPPMSPQTPSSIKKKRRK